MSDELREIRKLIKSNNCCGDCSFCNYGDRECEATGGKLWDGTVKEILAWHKSERKKWASRLLPKEQVVGNEFDIEKVASINGKNLTIAEIRKNLEEG